MTNHINIPVAADRDPIATAVVREVFTSPKHGTILGVVVEAGVLHAGDYLGTQRITSLRRYKEQVDEVKAGEECGVGIGDRTAEPGDTLMFSREPATTPLTKRIPTKVLRLALEDAETEGHDHIELIIHNGGHLIELHTPADNA